MSSHRSLRPILLLGFLLGLLQVSPGVLGDELTDVTFCSDRTVVWQGRSQVIPFRVSTAPAADIEAIATADGQRIEVLSPARVLEGRTLGYVRVQGLTPGPGELVIAGRSLPIEVRALDGDPHPGTSLRIVGPVTNATVTGEITLGVELFEDPQRSGRPHEILLRLPDGREIRPLTELSTHQGPWRRLAFTFSTSELGAGSQKFVAVARESGGATLESLPLTLTVQEPPLPALASGECESITDVERPRRFGQQQPQMRPDVDASGGKFVLNYSPRPAWCLPVNVKEPGPYQLILRVSGHFGGGAFPSVGIYVDDSPRPVTSGRLVAERWHRLPIGNPIQLDAGPHVLTAYFMNDFYARALSDRNLFLDAYELIPAGSPGATSRPTSRPTSRSREGRAAEGPLVSGPRVSGPLVSESLHIGLDRIIDGQKIGGTLRVRGHIQWRDARNSAPPTVELRLNGRVFGRQRSGNPQFWLSRGHLRAGANEIQLVATLDDGERVGTPTQTLWADAVDDAGRDFHRFTVQETRWSGIDREELSDQKRTAGHRLAILSSNGEKLLRLPENLSGRYDVYVEGMGEQFRGAPIARVSLLIADERSDVGEVKMWSGHDARRVGPVDLPAGEKRLAVAFINDLYEKDVGDRNLRLDSVILYEVLGADTTPPIVEIAYPPAGHHAHGADAVVARLSDNNGIAWADLVWDGQPQGLLIIPRPGDSELLLPLVLRNTEPGEHEIAVRVRDHSGNVVTSPTRSVIVTAQPPLRRGLHARAVHLLDRFGYGPEPRELAAVLIHGERDWLDDRLRRTSDDAGEQAAWGNARAHYPLDDNQGHVTQRIIRQLLVTPNPVRARFVHWVENHFSTWIRKTRARTEWAEHQHFDRLGVAPFRELLFASATSPAMLTYLDQHMSFVQRLNENYAREILELHTLGVHGGYTQEDVTRLAHLLTGWTASTMAHPDGLPVVDPFREFRFDPVLSDGREQRVVGVSFSDAPAADRYDRVRHMIEVLASHPATAHHICHKLAEHYVATPPPAALVADLERTFHETGGDMKALLTAMASHPDFWREDLSERLAKPLEYSVRICRAADAVHPWNVARLLNSSGAGLFDKDTPDGYSEEDEVYADSNALLQRWRFARSEEWALLRLVPGPWRKAPADAGARERWRHEVSDLVSLRLLGEPLGPTSLEAAVDVLEATEGTDNQRMLQLATFICQLPEANLR